MLIAINHLLEPRARILFLAVSLLVAAALPSPSQESGANAPVLPAPRAGLLPVPVPELDSLEPAVAAQLVAAQQALADLLTRSEVGDQLLAEAYGSVGQLYHAYNLVDAAESCYLNATRLVPRDFRWFHLLGHLQQRAGQLEEALTYYETARRLKPDSVATAVNLGNVYLQLNRLEEARQAFQAALNRDPESAAGHNGLGDLALADRRYAEAIPHYQAALQRVPDANRIHYSLAMAYRGLGDLDEAREHLELRGTVGVRPLDPLVDGLERLLQGEIVHLLRGRVAFSSGRFAEAARAFAKAVEAEPNSVTARINLGTALGQTGDLEGALQQYRAALRINPQNPTAHFNLGTLLVRQGKHAGAIEHFQSVLEVSPGDLEANRQLAKSLVSLGHVEEALPYYSKVVELAPDDEASLMDLANLLVTQARYREARDLLERAYRQLPHRPQTANALARILATSPDAAVRDGQRALELAMKAYQATKLLAHAETVAMALAELGHCDEAAEWQSKLVALAERANESELVARLEQQLARYERGSACAPATR